MCALSTPSAAATTPSPKPSRQRPARRRSSSRTTWPRTTSSCCARVRSRRSCTTTSTRTCGPACGRCCERIASSAAPPPRSRPTSRSSRHTTSLPASRRTDWLPVCRLDRSGSADRLRRDVVRRDDVDLGGDGLDRPGDGSVRLHDHLTGTTHVLTQVVVQDRRDPPLLDEREVVAVEVVGHEGPALPPEDVEGVEDRPVAATDGVDRGDVGVLSEEGDGLVADGVVEAVRVGGLDQSATTGTGTHRRPEAHLAFLLAAKRTATQSHQDCAVLVPEPLVDEVGSGRPGCTVVDADIGDALTEGDVGDQGYYRDAGVVESRDRVDDLGIVRGLEDDAHGSAVADPVEGLRELVRTGSLPEVEPRPDDRRPEH